MDRKSKNAGRWVLTLANLITVTASVAADWNETHVFNERWPSHARFHEVVGLGMTASLATLALTALWTDPDQRDRLVSGRELAAGVPLAYWGPSFPALLVRGTGYEDAPHPVGRLAGVPTNLLGAAATISTAIGGWLLDRRMRP